MAPRLRLEDLATYAKTLQKGQLITLEGTLKYREVVEDVEGTSFKHRIAEIHATSIKRLSKIVAQGMRLSSLILQLSSTCTATR